MPNNLEGISNIEVPEQKIEKTGLKVTESGEINFDDCALTEEDSLRKLKEAIKEAHLFDNSVKDPNEKDPNEKEDEITFEDCGKTR